jgi:EAL domain-containing protein (putative c-di-GMP-specific phosphodiesterase class I)/ActR/RegA family two-component response regulator
MAQKAPILFSLDDDESIGQVIASIGTQSGFEARSFTEHSAFCDAVDAHAPDVIVLDLQMPGCDGVEMLRFLGDIGFSSQIIIVSGVDQRTLASAEQYGSGRGLLIASAVQKPFDPDELEAILERIQGTLRPLSSTDLERAIEEGELTVFYQPTAQRFADGSWDITAVEALIRWNHPVRGLLTPDAFLAMGEEHGLSRAMTDFVIQQGIEQLKGWRAARINVGLRINISANLIADLDLPDRLDAVLTECGIDPGLICLEVTETAMLEQNSSSFDILTRLRVKDINLAIDDFGIGYSSLTQLFRMPFNEMKIDKSLTLKTPGSNEASIMVDALVGLAHKLGLTVCAEGVEQEDTLDFLGRIGCDCAQGYFISPPIAAAELPGLIENWNQRKIGDNSAAVTRSA